MTLKEKAELIVAEMEQDYPRSISVDLATIAIILTILIELVKLYMKCNSEAGAVAQLSNPGFFHRILMRRVIKRNIKRTVLQRHAEEVETSIIKSGKSVTVNDMVGFYDEVKHPEIKREEND